MKILLAAAAAAGLLIAAAQARESRQAAPTQESRKASRALAPRAKDWSAWTQPLGAAAPQAQRADLQQALAADQDIDVVDAHWMALTMWGEARSQSEEGMRAVGHVIHNRWLAKRHGTHVTDTVSAAWQFSCWNEGDPNRAAMLNIEALPTESEDHRLWLAAKRVAGEILSGRSADPTGGALFYHTTAVQPRWSQGVAPVTQIGNHLFFRAVR
jgi:spore germination cell wall hydrolase CwlJ-like protein